MIRTALLVPLIASCAGTPADDTSDTAQTGDSGETGAPDDSGRTSWTG
jgi:hypothetical protein